MVHAFLSFNEVVLHDVMYFSGKVWSCVSKYRADVSVAVLKKNKQVDDWCV